MVCRSAMRLFLALACAAAGAHAQSSFFIRQMSPAACNDTSPSCPITVFNSTGAPLLSGTDLADAFDFTISSLPPASSGGSITLGRGVYVLSRSLVIPRSGVTLTSEGGTGSHGDLYFNADGTYHGFDNKSSVLLIAEDMDGIVIGPPDASTGAPNLIFGVGVAGIAITGVPASTWPVKDEVLSPGAGIRAYTVDTVSITDVFVFRKQFGFNLGYTHPFAFNTVMDVVTLRDVYFAYNGIGIYAHDWVCNVRLTNLWGYLNQLSLLTADDDGVGQYDWIVSGVSSQSDGWAANVSNAASVISVKTTQDMALENVVIEPYYHNTFAPTPLIAIDLRVAGDPEWYRGHVVMRNVRLFSASGAAISIVGTGFVDITDLHAGSTGWQPFVGGNGTIFGPIVAALGPDTRVQVHGGYARSAANRSAWFPGVDVVADVRNFNPIGALATPFDDAQAVVGIEGTAAQPTMGTTYLVRTAPLLLTAYPQGSDSGVISILAPVRQEGSSNVTFSSVLDMRTAAFVNVPLGYAVVFSSFTQPLILTCAAA